MAQWNRADDIGHEPVERTGFCEFVDPSGIDARIDGAANQCHACRLSRIVTFAHQRDRRHDGNRRLTNRNHMDARAEHTQEPHDIADGIVKPEPAINQRNMPCVLPISDPNIMIRKQSTNRAAQQCREMPRHRRDNKHPRLLDLDRFFEMQKCAERPGVGCLLGDANLLPTDHDVIDAKGRPIMADAGLSKHIER